MYVSDAFFDDVTLKKKYRSCTDTSGHRPTFAKTKKRFFRKLLKTYAEIVYLCCRKKCLVWPDGLLLGESSLLGEEVTKKKAITKKKAMSAAAPRTKKQIP